MVGSLAAAKAKPVPVPARAEGLVEVCLAALNFHPVYAGPAIRFSRYLPGFASRGVSMRVFAGTPELSKATASGLQRDWGGWKLGRTLPVTELHRVAVHRVRLPDEGTYRRALRFGYALARHCRRPVYRPDVVQLLACGVPLVPTLLRLRRMGIPTVYTATMLPDPRRRHPVRRELLRRYIAGPMHLVDAVVVSSDVMRETFREWGLRTAIHVIPNGVDTERFRPAEATDKPATIRRTLGIGPQDTLALFLGPIEPRKGTDLLLEAWARLARRWPRLHLVLAGPRMDIAKPGNEAFHRKISHLVEASGAADRVHFTGMVPDPEVYLRAADLFVFPSRREGMPNVVPEAMASGLPTVMTPFVGLPTEFGQAGRHYLLADFDADVLAERIGDLLRNAELRRTMGVAARRWVENEMEVDRSVQRYAELYRAMASQSSPRDVER